MFVMIKFMCKQRYMRIIFLLFAFSKTGGDWKILRLAGCAGCVHCRLQTTVNGRKLRIRNIIQGTYFEIEYFC
ncbi:hypothetical protein NQ317_015126 [Molorchus minor]|uniref:Secreted protein n=1 Tax=Molorchus minor TaxID=1323400 RepID=A0ABQ9K4U9_9CUCU|nr:hypothetical protein NQ317_015126 [Molorchus minor]